MTLVQWRRSQLVWPFRIGPRWVGRLMLLLLALPLVFAYCYWRMVEAVGQAWEEIADAWAIIGDDK